MSIDTAVKVQNISKCYQVYEKPKDRLKQLFFRSKAKYHKAFWALNDISFEVKKGQSIGIIGRNGSGKSTLLQIISKILQPTSGEISVDGKVAALLELGAGFNPEFTGRENIYMNAAILGLKRKEIDKVFDKIIAFADIGDYIEQPVKTYSSGMFVRLAFSIQACVEPDILIIDEALSVGDIFFQQKSAKRMRELREKGTTLIFVSHDMSAIRDLCEYVVYLKKGKLAYFGPSPAGIRHYFAEDQAGSALLEKIALSQSNNISLPKEKIAEFKDTACWVNQECDITEGCMAKVLAIRISDNNQNSVLKAKMGEELNFQVLYQVYTEKPVHVTIALKNRHDQVINSSGSYTKNKKCPILSVGDCAIFEMRLKCNIEAGEYTFSVTLGQELELHNRGIAIDETPWLGPLIIDWDYESQKAPWLGMFGLPVDCDFIKMN